MDYVKKLQNDLSQMKYKEYNSNIIVHNAVSIDGLHEFKI